MVSRELVTHFSYYVFRVRLEVHQSFDKSLEKMLDRMTRDWKGRASGTLFPAFARTCG